MQFFFSTQLIFFLNFCYYFFKFKKFLKIKNIFLIFQKILDELMRIFLQLFVLGKLFSRFGRVSILITLFGIFIGFFVGICLKFESASDSKKESHLLDLENEFKLELIDDFWIQCIIALQDSAETPEKYLMAIYETFGKKCNETIFITNSDTIYKKFSVLFNILLMKSAVITDSWRSFQKLLNLINLNQFQKTLKKKWIVIINEKNYIIVKNLLGFLTKHSNSNNKPIVIGKIEYIT